MRVDTIAAVATPPALPVLTDLSLHPHVGDHECHSPQLLLGVCKHAPFPQQAPALYHSLAHVPLLSDLHVGLRVQEAGRLLLRHQRTKSSSTLTLQVRRRGMQLVICMREGALVAAQAGPKFRNASAHFHGAIPILESAWQPAQRLALCRALGLEDAALRIELVLLQQLRLLGHCGRMLDHQLLFQWHRRTWLLRVRRRDIDIQTGGHALHLQDGALRCLRAAQGRQSPGLCCLFR
mmetsp:Transcript_82998/g.230526  ORF Transcript_82998/g.230526 Transcript_82998/m.230526 type:complete len:236 (-) Transcript_82998:562-1269(-)